MVARQKKGPGAFGLGFDVAMCDAKRSSHFGQCLRAVADILVRVHRDGDGKAAGDGAALTGKRLTDQG